MFWIPTYQNRQKPDPKQSDLRNPKELSKLATLCCTTVSKGCLSHWANGARLLWWSFGPQIRQRECQMFCRLVLLVYRTPKIVNKYLGLTNNVSFTHFTRIFFVSACLFSVILILTYSLITVRFYMLLYFFLVRDEVGWARFDVALSLVLI